MNWISFNSFYIITYHPDKTNELTKFHSTLPYRFPIIKSRIKRELEIYQKKKNSKHFPRKKNIRCEYCVQRNALYDIPYNTQPTRDKSWKVHFDEIDATEESMPFLMSWNLSREYSRSRFLLAFEPFTECISSRDPPSDAPTSAGRSLALHLQNCFSSTYPVSYRITQPFHSEQNRRIEDSNIEV